MYSIIIYIHTFPIGLHVSLFLVNILLSIVHEHWYTSSFKYKLLIFLPMHTYSWLYNLFDDYVSDKIKDELNDEVICSIIASFPGVEANRASTIYRCVHKPHPISTQLETKLLSHSQVKHAIYMTL